VHIALVTDFEVRKIRIFEQRGIIQIENACLTNSIVILARDFGRKLLLRCQLKDLFDMISSVLVILLTKIECEHATNLGYNEWQDRS